MKKLIALFLAVVIVLSAFPVKLYAGPWTVQKGKVWGEVFGRYFFSKDFFDPKGRKHRWADGGFSEIWDLEAKLEYGVTDNFNLLLGVPYSWSRWKNDWGKINANWGKFKHEGFKTISAGAKYRFMSKPVVAAIQGKVFIHTQGTDQVKQPDLYEYGDAIELRGLIGKAFQVHRKLMYFSFESGYRWTSSLANKNHFANAIPVFAEAGFAPLDRVMLKGEVDFWYSDHTTGIRKDSLTWRVGPIFNVFGKGFNSIEKGGESSLNVELQYGQTAWARGDGNTERYQNVSAAQEFILKVQALF